MKGVNKRVVLTWSAITCLGVIILVNIVFHPLTKSLAQSDSSQASLPGDTNKQQQQQQAQEKTQEEIVPPKDIPHQEESYPLPLGKLIDNIPTKDNKTVYITFDDGPGEYTKEIAAILQKHNAHASFFWIGKQVTDELGQFGHQMIEQGNIIGSHTMRHDALGKENGAKQKSDLTQTAKLISNKVQHPIVYMRPPYGSVNKETRVVAKELGEYIMFWQVDSLDWSLAHHPEKILANIKNGGVKPGSIILMHERKQTVEMLPKVIEYLQGQGYTLAALPSSPVPKETKPKPKQ
ncbi:polysaccharide deacetylase family protein [Aneurinibacillus uraniidurans]|uniref:polysaccharide deacetylase family protein n=1 Tax=Aneurinibacillus uraniidurans TaxID=2966586 RepID=UPI002349F750|nr:polysaccharide deacetylase family protein [Aneurinibacillus sp. B1]WCN39246.1 polysaccharide deacetylase family protein [Aneurinibacillus sp. B1]